MANQILAAQMIPRLGVTGLASPLQGNYLPILTCFAFFSTSNTTICLEGARRLSCGILIVEIRPGWNYNSKMIITLEP